MAKRKPSRFDATSDANWAYHCGKLQPVESECAVCGKQVAFDFFDHRRKAVAKRKPSPFKGRKNQLRLMRLDLNDGKMLKMTVEEMAKKILEFAGRTGDPEIEIYVWPYVFDDEEITKVQPNIGLVFKNGCYWGHGLGGTGKDRFAEAVKQEARLQLSTRWVGTIELTAFLTQIEGMRERTIKVWR